MIASFLLSKNVVYCKQHKNVIRNMKVKQFGQVTAVLVGILAVAGLVSGVAMMM